MRNTMMKTLVALMISLATCINDMPVGDFDLQKFAGKWYMVGMATNAQWFVDHKAGMKMGTAVFKPTDEGDVDVSYANLNPGGDCWRRTHLAKKTETPGRFTFRSPVWNNDNDMRVVAVSYDDYAIVHTIKTQDGAAEVLNKLYSRNNETSLQETFTQFSLGTGVLPENIVMLPENGECPEV